MLFRVWVASMHASLLPRWRGAAPIQRAIEAGDSETGVCIMQMEAGFGWDPRIIRARCRCKKRLLQKIPAAVCMIV